MDNVLIDERRVHVDFSQSVAKVRWKGKGDSSCIVIGVILVIFVFSYSNNDNIGYICTIKLRCNLNVVGCN